ncbi:hypothetical protein EJ110_NYTH28894 [Nymphaea thermarum]|nr:hypothetical protein EJ110_NYTH28894 [Nymphaea thermarum]
MNSSCVYSCLEVHAPVRATYVNLYKWPESDAEFVRKVAQGGSHGRPREYQRIVDSYSCRQMYLRSYTFTRKETLHEKAKKCFGKMKNMDCGVRIMKGRKYVVKKAGRKMVSKTYDALVAMFFRILACTTVVDVVDPM